MSEEMRKLLTEHRYYRYSGAAYCACTKHLGYFEAERDGWHQWLDHIAELWPATPPADEVRKARSRIMGANLDFWRKQ